MILKILTKITFFACAALCCTGIAYSQNVEPQEYDLYKKGVELYEKARYADADAVFVRALDETNSVDKLTLSEITAYRAMCAIEMEMDDMETQVENLLDTYPESKHKNPVTFALANKFFQDKKYRKSVKWYNKTESRTLSYNQHIECIFKTGYSYFEIQQYDKAAHSFVQIKDVTNNPYGAPAMYYYGHSEYVKKNYTSAQTAFEKVLEDDRFAAHAAIYLVQIYFLRQDYEQAVSTGVKMLPTIESPYNKEAARLIAESYYHMKDYDKAREYFTKYTQGQAALSRTDDYFMGLVEFNSSNYKAAATHFEIVVQQKPDSLSQNAFYYLGSSYIQLNEKTKAQKAFEEASKQNYSSKIAEDALLQYAKLSLELENNGAPLQKYFDKYPSQAKNPEMRNYAASYYITQRDYKKALENLIFISSPSEKQKSDIQRLNFLVGKEYYDKQQYRDAITYFESVIKSPGYDAKSDALAYYYQADAYYSLKDYQKAQELFEKFNSHSGAYRTGNEYQATLYNLGYCTFKQKNYEKASSWFQQFVKVAAKEYHTQVADAYNRIGDCNYVQGKYWPASENFNKAIEMNAPNSDYSLYRKAFAYGLLGRYDQKTTTLKELVTNYPNSGYAAAGLLELGRTYVQNNQYNEAEKAFKQLAEQYPKGSFATQAYIELGLLSSNTKQPSNAIAYYKQALQKAQPNSEEAKSAREGLQNAYADINNLEGYYEYMQNIGITESSEEKEQALFLAAEKLALSNDCANAITSFKKFIADFPNSQHNVQAYSYIANCYFRQEQYQLAIDNYKHVIDDTHPNSYKESAIINSALANEKLENYTEALSNLNLLAKTTLSEETRLTAYIALARIQYNQLQNYREAGNSAQSALLATSITPEQAREMKFIKANCWKNLGLNDDAYLIYKEIIDANLNDKENAESLYHTIDITFAKGNFEEGEKMVIDFGQSKANVYQYWVARSFIALADQYAQRGNKTQAEATYKSIIEGYANASDGIKELATQQLNLLK